MKKHVFKNLVSYLYSFILVLTIGGNRLNASPITPKPNVTTYKTKAATLLSQQPVQFLENKGQMRDMADKPVPFVLFKAEAPGVDLYVTEQGLTYVFLESEEEEEENEKKENKYGWRTEKIKVDYERVDMILAGANLKMENVVKEDPSIADHNYLFDGTTSAINHVKKFSKLTVKEIYPGIDWVLYGSSKTGFKYDFIVHPGADAKQIELVYKSKKQLTLSEEGDVELTTRHGRLTEKAPYSYLSNNHQMVESHFRIISAIRKNGQYETHVGFNIAPANVSSDLVIDPQLLWGTCYGGSNADGVYCVDTDPAGNLFLCGYGSSTNFPLLNAGSYYQTTPSGGFILKFSNTGTLLWATFFGSPGQGSGPFVPPSTTNFLATDNNGNVFLSGIIGSGVLPVLNASTYFQGTSGGSVDAYIAKFSNNGTLLWATYYGGSLYDDATGLATDPSGNVFLCGTTQSTNFPLQNNSTYFEAGITGTHSGYIVKFDNLGNRLWATYLKGCGVPKVTADPSGNIYLTGNTSTLIPLLNPGGSAYYQGAIAGSPDAYVLKFTNSGAHVWGTYYGGPGSGQETGYSIVTDKSANVFVTGISSSTNFPVMNPGGGAYFQSTFAGTGPDMFILKFDSNLNRLWATLFGGTRLDAPSESDNLCIDTCGNIWMGFNTTSRNLPFQQACNGGLFDNTRDTSLSTAYSNIYLARFSNNGNLLWSSYYGGDGDSHRCTWAADKLGNVFMVGEFHTVTNLATYPTLNAGGTSYYSGPIGGDDIALAKFASGQAAAQSFSYSSRCAGDTASQLPQSLFSFGTGGTFSASPGMTINLQNGRIFPATAAPGTYTVTYYSANCACPGSVILPQGTATLAVLVAPVVNISVSQQTLCVNQQATLTASGANTYSWSTTANTQTIAVQANTPSTFTYSVRGTSSGCSHTKTISIYGVPNPTVNAASNPTSLCVGEQATVTASGASSYVWSTGPTTSSIIAHATSTNALSFNVTGTDINGCTNSSFVTIPVLPVPSLSLTTTKNVLCVGEQAILSASGASTYTWNTGIKGGTLSAIAVKGPALNYTVTATGSNGCTANKTISIGVSLCEGLSESANEGPQLRIFPNPNSGEFTIVAGSTVSLTLVNELGQFIKQIELNEKNNRTLLVADLAAGIYFLKDKNSVTLTAYKIVVSE